MRSNLLLSSFWAAIISLFLFSSVAISDDEKDDHADEDIKYHPLFNNDNPMADFIGIHSKEFWEIDNEDYSARRCERRKNHRPGRLLNCVTVEAVRAHQRAMQDIADATGGNRVAGSDGHDRSAEYVRDQLLAAGYQVRMQEFSFQTFRPEGPSTLEQTAPVALTYIENTDYRLMSQTDAGTASANVTAVDLAPGAGNTSSSGCEATDFAGFPRGHIALVQRGACSFRLKAENAAAAGALGVIIFNQGNSPDRTGLINATLSADYTGGIPVFFATYENGISWAETAGLSLNMVADVFRGEAVTNNVIAESAKGDPTNVVMLGAHLDSVNEGPGIQDNGSGSAAILEVALQMKNVKPNNKLRFAWWSGEESGLIGSDFYVDSLTPEEHDSIAVYLNFDMIGSPNFARFVYDGDGSDFGLSGPLGSAAVEKYFELFYSVQGYASQGTEISFRSDYARFFETGIPFGGLFTGAEGLKTAEQVLVYGGTEGEQYDPCYHLACDTYDNINLDALSLNADSAALAALLFSKTSAPIDAQQVPVAAPTLRAFSSNTNDISEVDTRGNYYVR